MRNRNKVKFAVICFLILIFMNLFPMPHKVNQTISCNVFDTEDPSFQGTASVGFIGTYYDSRMLSDSFKGTIRISHSDLFHIPDLDCNLKYGQFTENTLMEINPGNGTSKLMGFFYGMDDRDSFILWILSPDEDKPNISHGRYFVTNSDMTLDEIYSVINQVKRNE